MSIFKKTKIDRQKKFEEQVKGVSEKEKRDAESALLKPESIQPYTNELPKHKNELASRTVLIVFRDKRQMDLVGELFSIRESCNKEAYITNIQLLEYIAQQVKDGKYIVDGEQIKPVKKKKKNKKGKVKSEE